MNSQEFTPDELKMLSQYEDSDKPQLGAGGRIPPQQALRMINAYEDFLNAPGNENIKDQTRYVSFDSQKLIEWLQSSGMDEVRIYFAMDLPVQKFTVVLWAFRGQKPVLTESPYNIGGRRP